MSFRETGMNTVVAGGSSSVFTVDTTLYVTIMIRTTQAAAVLGTNTFLGSTKETFSPYTSYVATSLCNDLTGFIQINYFNVMLTPGMFYTIGRNNNTVVSFLTQVNIYEGYYGRSVTKFIKPNI